MRQQHIIFRVISILLLITFSFQQATYADLPRHALATGNLDPNQGVTEGDLDAFKGIVGNGEETVYYALDNRTSGEVVLKRAGGQAIRKSNGEHVIIPTGITIDPWVTRWQRVGDTWIRIDNPPYTDVRMEVAELLGIALDPDTGAAEDGEEKEFFENTFTGYTYLHEVGHEVLNTLLNKLYRLRRTRGPWPYEKLSRIDREVFASMFAKIGLGMRGDLTPEEEEVRLVFRTYGEEPHKSLFIDRKINRFFERFLGDLPVLRFASRNKRTDLATALIEAGFELTFTNIQDLTFSDEPDPEIRRELQFALARAIADGKLDAMADRGGLPEGEEAGKKAPTVYSTTDLGDRAHEIATTLRTEASYDGFGLEPTYSAAAVAEALQSRPTITAVDLLGNIKPHVPRGRPSEERTAQVIGDILAQHLRRVTTNVYSTIGLEKEEALEIAKSLRTAFDVPLDNNYRAVDVVKLLTSQDTVSTDELKVLVYPYIPLHRPNDTIIVQAIDDVLGATLAKVEGEAWDGQGDAAIEGPAGRIVEQNLDDMILGGLPAGNGKVEVVMSHDGSRDYLIKEPVAQLQGMIETIASRGHLANFNDKALLHKRALEVAHAAYGQSIAQPGKKIYIPREYLEEAGLHDLIAAIDAKRLTSDIQLVSLEQAKNISKNKDKHFAANIVVILRQTDLDENTRKQSECRLVVLDNYHFLHLPAAMELARSIVSGDMKAAVAFYSLLMHTTEAAAQDRVNALWPRRIWRIPLPAIEQNLIENVDDLLQEYAEFMKNA